MKDRADIGKDMFAQGLLSGLPVLQAGALVRYVTEQIHLAANYTPPPEPEPIKRTDARTQLAQRLREVYFGQPCRDWANGLPNEQEGWYRLADEFERAQAEAEPIHLREEASRQEEEA